MNLQGFFKIYVTCVKKIYLLEMHSMIVVTEQYSYTTEANSIEL